jgi:uncharacterized protein YwgA
MRNDKELVSDRLLLLYAIQQSNKYGYMDRFKLQKIPFASELAMNKSSTKGLNYTFFRYLYGPMSKEVYEDGGALHVGGLITTLKGPIELTEEGLRLVDSVSLIYEENRDITSYIDVVSKEYAPLDFGPLKKKIYDLTLTWGGDVWTVREFPAYTDMLKSLSEAEAKISFRLDDDWIDSLWGPLNYTKEQTAKLKVLRKVG